MSARELITEHLDLWTGAVTKKSSSGRGSNGKIELTGIKKLREFILELALRGKLTEQLPTDEPAQEYLKRVKTEREVLGEGPAKRKRSATSPVDDKPFSIPKSWSWERLGDIGLIASSRRVRQRDWQDHGIPFYRAREIVKLSQQGHVNNELFISESLFSELAQNGHIPEVNDLMLTGVGTIGVPYIVKQDDKFYFKDASVLIFKNFLGVSPQFLYYFCHSPFWKNSIHEDSMGTTVHTLTIIRANQALIPLPPIEEQHRIVQKVDELMGLCDRLEQQTSDQLEAHETLVDTLLGTLTQSENATELADNWARLAAHFDTLFTTEQSIDKLKQTILQLAVMGRLAKPANPEEEPIESLVENLASERADGDNKTSQRKKKDSPQIASKGFRHPIPENWKWIKFGETWINSFYGPRFAKHDYVPSGGIPTVRTTDMDDKGRIDLRNAPTVLVPANKKELYLLEKNDILVTRSGSIGVTAVYDLETPAIPSAYLIRLRLCPSINPHYVFIYLNSPHGQKSLGVHSTAVGVPNVNATKMASFDFPLPPKEEQSRIVQKVDELIALCDQLKERLNQASETRNQLAEAVVQGALN